MSKEYASSVQDKLTKMMQGTGFVSKANPSIYNPKPRDAEEIEKNPEHVRVLPYKDYPDPFLELYMHYNVGSTILCPKKTPYCDSDECPICDFVEGLMKTDFKTAIKKVAQLRIHIPLVVRGLEFSKDGKPQIKFWSLPSTYNPGYTRELPLSMQMMKVVNDPDIGRFWDPIDGTDIVVTRLKAAKDEYSKPTIEFRRRTSKLMDDKEKANLLIESVPDWNEIIDVPSYEKLQNVLDKYINSLKQEQSTNGKPNSKSVSNDLDDFESDNTFDDNNDDEQLDELSSKLDDILKGNK